MSRKDIEAGKKHIRRWAAESSFIADLQEVERQFLKSPKGVEFLREMAELREEANQADQARKQQWEDETGETDDLLTNLRYCIALAGPDEIGKVMGLEPSEAMEELYWSSMGEVLQVIRGILKRRHRGTMPTPPVEPVAAVKYSEPMTMARAGKLLGGINPKTVARWREQGKIQAGMVGKRIRIALSDLEKHGTK